MLVYLQMLETEADRTKFEEIYHLYRDLMYVTAFSILHNEHDAEDAVHQAFIKVADNIKKIDDPKCPKSKFYIVTITENKSIDLYRAKKRRNEVPLVEAFAGVQIEYRGGNEVAQCMSKLPARYRQVLLLKFHFGFSTREIADMLDISLSNALKIEQRAKAKLKVLCEEAEIYDFR